MSATTILPDNEAATIAGAVVDAVVSQGDLPDELGGEEVDGAQNASDGDEDLQAEPSQIREVIVEAPEVKFLLPKRKYIWIGISCRFRPIRKLEIQN